MSERKKSKYKEKRERGNMMYGPGCCAHGVTFAQVEAAKQAARRSDHKFWSPGWKETIAPSVERGKKLLSDWAKRRQY